MPKIVDHDQRRRELAQAIWTIIALRGLNAVTLRSVAAEAGVSMGTVQHYFRTKDQMILFACQHMVDLAQAGASSLLEKSHHPDEPESIIRAVMHQTLPVDEQQRFGSAVWLAFVAHAIVDDELAEIIRHAWSGMHEILANQLRAAQQFGKVSDDVDIEREALSLATVADGLVQHAVVGQISADDALAVIDHHLNRLFAKPSYRA